MKSGWSRFRRYLVTSPNAGDFHGRQTLIFGVKALALWGVLAGTACAAPPRFTPDRLPYRIAWGPYTVVVDRKPGIPAGDLPRQYVRILDAKGRTVKEVRDAKIGDVRIEEATGTGVPELWIDTTSGGMSCCLTQYLFTRDGGPVRNLLIFEGGYGNITGARDLNRDGRPEFIALNDALDGYEGRPHAVSPTLTRVIGWNGSRYVDQTRRFPDRARSEGQQFRRRLWEKRRATGEMAEEERRYAALGYYGSAVAAGEEAQAEAWLKKNAPSSTRHWVLSRKAGIRRALRDSARKIRQNPAPVLGTWD
ncbi:MAG: hypothetical protein KY468_10155 [Armatimonadetes bacterium]|nr:hypothetical protein [Armatimonadota bacterium]